MISRRLATGLEPVNQFAADVTEDNFDGDAPTDVSRIVDNICP